MATRISTTNPSGIDRAAVMRRAWSIFGETYHYPLVPFASIGRRCFTWALREAWRRTRQEARFAAMRPDVRRHRIVMVERELEALRYAGSHVNTRTRSAPLHAELDLLQQSA